MAFLEGGTMSGINERLLDERLAALEAARGWSPRLVSKLEGHIRGAGDAELLRVNPVRFASEKGLAEAETIDLFLHAASVGLFDMNWIIHCPLCSCVIESFRGLSKLNSHCRCTACHVDLVAALDDMIAVTFTINPGIRQTMFHDPDSLSVEDYIFRFKSSMEGLIPDGTPFTALKEMVAKVVAFVEPGATAPLEVEIADGILRVASVDSDAGFVLVIDPALAAADQHFSVACGDQPCDEPTGVVAPGRLRFNITNTSSKRQAFIFMGLPPGAELPPLHFVPFLAGKRLLTTQTFRDLFRSEVTSEGLAIKDITLLFTDLKGSTALYDRIGDLNAFALVQQHFDRLHDVAVRNDGAIVKTIGDAVMAAFRDPQHAVRAALDMRREIAAVNRGSADRELILKVGVHKGAAIAVTLNDRLDYFGQTVNIAARVQSLADADEIFLSKDVYDASAVREMLAPFPVEPRSARLRGLHEEIPVIRVASEEHAEAA
jgi:class 3 adenylate cyclase